MLSTRLPSAKPTGMSLPGVCAMRIRVRFEKFKTLTFDQGFLSPEINPRDKICGGIETRIPKIAGQNALAPVRFKKIILESSWA